LVNDNHEENLPCAQRIHLDTDRIEAMPEPGRAHLQTIYSAICNLTGIDINRRPTLSDTRVQQWIFVEWHGGQHCP